MQIIRNINNLLIGKNKKTKKQKQNFYIFLSVILLILLILTNRYAPGNGSSYEDLNKELELKNNQEDIVETTPTVIQKINYDKNAFVILDKNLAFDFQNTASFKKLADKKIELNNQIYQIEVNAFSNLCSMDDSTYKCDQQEKNLEHAKILKLWRENRNVFALQAIEINFKDEKINNIVITKDTQVNYFDKQEIEMWQGIFNKKLTTLK